MAMKRYRLGGKALLQSEANLGKPTGAGETVSISSSGCATVKPRKGAERKLEAENVVKLVLALAGGDKLPPIGLSNDGTLVYGAHRLAAAQLLATPPERRGLALARMALSLELTKEQKERLKEPRSVGRVELRVDRGVDPEAELRENAQRRQLSPTLVREQLQLLVDFGYGTSKGRPKKGSKGNAMARLAEIWGVTTRNLQLHLSNLDGTEEQNSQPLVKSKKKKKKQARLQSKDSRTGLELAIETFLSDASGKADMKTRALAQELQALLKSSK